MKVQFGKYNFDLNNNRPLWITGPNGVGKSTLLHAMVKNKVNLFGESTKINYLFQMPLAALGERRSIDLVETFETFLGEKFIPHSFLIDFIKSPLGKREIRHLSGGENQWLKLITMLSYDADLYIWDEPTTYLDSDKKILVKEIISQLMRKHSFIIVDHDHEFIRECHRNIIEIALK